MKIFLALIIGIVMFAVIAGRASGPAERPGSPAVYAELNADSDCDSLQASFDLAEANGKAARNRGNAELGRVTTSYMKAADDRMREIGCY